MRVVYVVEEVSGFRSSPAHKLMMQSQSYFVGVLYQMPSVGPPFKRHYLSQHRDIGRGLGNTHVFCT